LRPKTYHADASVLVPGRMNSVMDSVREYVHFGFKFSRKLFDLTDESEPLDLRGTKSPAIRGV
jgi:hypothetical protein